MDKNYRSIFKDIISGYSEVYLFEKKVYIKHLSALDQIDLEELYDKFFNDIKVRGVPTTEESLERLKEEGVWSKKDDSKIKQQIDYLQSLKNTKSNLILKKEIDKFNEDIEIAQKELDNLNNTKFMLLGQTCEKWADTRVTEHYLLRSLYKDENFTIPLYSTEELDYISAEELMEIISKFNSKINSINDKVIQEVVLQDFYSMYFPFCENVMNFYNKPLFNLSSNQVKLIVYTKMYKNIFERHSNIPEDIRRDPDKILDFINAQEKAKPLMDNLKRKKGVSMVVGGSEEDHKYLGVTDNKYHKSFQDILKENNGKMDMKQIMENFS